MLCTLGPLCCSLANAQAVLTSSWGLSVLQRMPTSIAMSSNSDGLWGCKTVAFCYYLFLCFLFCFVACCVVFCGVL